MLIGYIYDHRQTLGMGHQAVRVSGPSGTELGEEAEPCQLRPRWISLFINSCTERMYSSVIWKLAMMVKQC